MLFDQDLQTPEEQGFRDHSRNDGRERCGVGRLTLVLGLAGLTIGVFLVSFSLAPSSAEPAAPFQHGMAAVEEQNWLVVAECVKVLDDQPDFKPHRHLLRGFLYLADDRTKEALIQFSYAKSHPETREESYLQAGKICYRLKEYREAVQLLTQVVDWNSDRLEAHRLLAAAQFDIGAMEHAIGSLTQVIRLAPHDFRPHYMMGTILRDYEQYHEAGKAFESGSHLVQPASDDDQRIRVAWSDCHLHLRNYKKAIAVLQPAKISPEVLVRRAEAHFNLRHFDEARKLVEEVLPLAPLQEDVVSIAVRVFEQANEFDRAIPIVKAALENDPQSVVLLNSAADVLGAAGRLEEAQSYRESAGKLGELQNRFSQLHQAAVRDVNNSELRLELAEVADQLGKTEIALSWYEAAIGMAPGNEVIQKSWEGFRSKHSELFKPASGQSGKQP